MAKLVHNVQKKQHKERSQTQERARYGLLEKKKDYRLRAADYHKKQAALKALKAKAANHNPDEYYHAMTSKRTDDRGIIVSDRGNETLSVQQVQLLKTQDSNYMKTLTQNELKQIEKLEKNLLFKASGKHSVFVESFEEQKKFNVAKHFDTDSSLVKNKENRLRISQLEDQNKILNNYSDESTYSKEILDDKKVKKLKLLKAKMERVKKFQEVSDRMDVQRELMKKGEKKKVVDKSGKVQFKWKNVRKR